MRHTRSSTASSRGEQLYGTGHESLMHRRPSAVRMGIFCRFGSLEDSLPVAATACWNDE